MAKRGFAAMTPEQRAHALEKARQARKDGDGKIKKKVLTPIKAIRAKCLECSSNQYKEVVECPVIECSLWPYRLGKRPTIEIKQDYISATKSDDDTDFDETDDEVLEEEIEIEEDE